MIALDTNILVYAHRRDSRWHREAVRTVRELAEGPATWGLPWSCLHEFMAIATHPRIFDPPSPLEKATEQVSAWCESPSVVLLAESAGFWDKLQPVIAAARVTGPRIHDARIAALCLHHGVRELWTADRDLSRFPALAVVNPLLRG